VETLLLLSFVFSFIVNDVGVASYLLEMAFYNFGVEVLRIRDILLVSFKSLLPGDVLGGVTVLYDTVVLLGDHVATVVKGLQGACE
jgi:hypothetical protein